MKPFLHASWVGSHFQLWATTSEVSPEVPISIQFLENNILDDLYEKVLHDQELVPFERSSFEFTAYCDSSSQLEVENSCRMSGLALIDLMSSFKDEVEEFYQLGNSIPFWCQASRLLLGAIARGSYYPGILRRGSSLESHWHLFLQTEGIKESFSSLVKAMPGIANQYFFSGRSQEENAYAALSSHYESTGDEIIRSFLSRYSLLTGPIEDDEITPEQSIEEVRLRISRRDLLVIQWMNSLSDKTSLLDLSVTEQNTLERIVSDWNAPLRGLQEIATPTPKLSIFAPIVESRSDMLNAPWTLQLSLDIPNSSSQEEEALQQQVEVKDFFLLKEAGRARSVIPELRHFKYREECLEQSITPNQAYAIIEKYKKPLEELGFKLVVPSWWGDTKGTVGVVVKLKPVDEAISDTVFNASNLVQFSWSLKIGDEEISLEQFENMLDEENPLLFVGGRWIALDPKDIKANILHLKSLSSGQKFTLFDALRLGVSGLTEMSQFDLVRIDAEGWIQRILEFGKGDEQDRIVPPTFHGSLRPYQEVGVAWLSFLSRAGVGGCLADDMGLGKTIQVLALLAKEIEHREKSTINLLVVPMSIIGNWESEAARFVPGLRVYIHHGAARLTGEEFDEAIEEVDLVITTYSILHRDYRSFRKVKWGRIILDEAQNIKNTDAKQTKAVRALIDELSRSEVGSGVTESEDAQNTPQTTSHTGGPLRLALTGTPLENRLQELWSILDFINPGLLGSTEEFKKQFVNPIEKNRDERVTNSLSKLIKPFILRRVKTDPEIAADLPEKIEMENVVHLTSEQADLYSATLRDMLPKVRESEGIHRKGAILSVITKLKQICVHPALLLKDGSPLAGRSGKLNLLEELLETQLAEGDRALVFTQFAQWGSLLAPHLAERFSVEVPFFHGGLNRSAREDIVSKFQKDDGPPILVLSLKAGGFGLNLTRANQVIHLDQWWNPAVQNQATDRAYRIGQKVTVQVRNLITKGTLEEKINALHKDKIALANSVVGTTRNVITELTPEALEELLTLQTSVLLEGQ